LQRTNRLLIYGSYKDKAAIAAHSKTDHYKKMGRAMKQEDLLAAPMKVLFTKEAGGFASKL
jgi:quinol monooxygenase YgiN